VGPFYCLKTLSSTVQCIGLFSLVEDDVHHGFLSQESGAATKIKEEKVVSSSSLPIVLEHFVPVISKLELRQLRRHTVKKLLDIPVPSRDVTYQIIPRRE
jgi:hypothetical protein